MPHSGGIITAPVTNNDVNATLGTAHTDVGAMCTDSHVNIWSKYKPIKVGIIDTMSQWDYTNNTWKSTATWWKGSDGKCGFTLYSSVKLSDIIENTNGTMNGWTYTGTPIGGASSPYRLTDFAGYNHQAVPIVANFNCNEKVMANSTFQATCMQPLDYDNITIGDITPNGNQLYFGVVITNSAGTTVLTKVTSSTAGNADIHFTFPSSIGQGSGYRCYPFLAKNAITLGGSDSNNTYYTCPNLNYKTFNVVSTYINMKISAIYLGTTRVTVTIENLDVSGHTITASIRFTSSNYYDAMKVGEYQKAEETIAGNGKKIYSFTGLDENKNYMVYVLIDKKELRKTNIMQEIALEQ